MPPSFSPSRSLRTTAGSESETALLIKVGHRTPRGMPQGYPLMHIDDRFGSRSFFNIGILLRYEEEEIIHTRVGIIPSGIHWHQHDRRA